MNCAYILPRPSPVVPAYPDCRPQAWGGRYTEIFDSGRLSYHAHDFFEPQRPFDVPGVGTVVHPDVMFIRAIAHNWPDSFVLECVLSPLRARV